MPAHPVTHCRRAARWRQASSGERQRHLPPRRLLPHPRAERTSPAAMAHVTTPITAERPCRVVGRQAGIASGDGSLPSGGVRPVAPPNPTSPVRLGRGEAACLGRSYTARLTATSRLACRHRGHHLPELLQAVWLGDGGHEPEVLEAGHHRVAGVAAGDDGAHVPGPAGAAWPASAWPPSPAGTYRSRITAAKGRPSCCASAYSATASLPLARHLHLAAEPLQHPPGHAQHDVLVVHHQHAPAAGTACPARPARRQPSAPTAGR